MTYEFLRAQVIAGPVARVEIEAKTGKAQVTNASVKVITRRTNILFPTCI